MRGQIGNRRRATRQTIQRLGKILGQPARIQVEMLDNPMQIRILQLQNLMQPMHQLHIRIAPQLAKYGGAFNGFIAQAIQLSKQATRLISAMDSDSFDEVARRSLMKPKEVFSLYHNR
jgi:hypothetical protein